MQFHDADRTKIGDRDWSVVCFQCGRQFEATRSDASFCSAKCRVAHGREAQKFENFLTWLNRLASGILTGAQKYKRSKLVYETMLKLQKDVNAAVGLFETD